MSALVSMIPGSRPPQLFVVRRTQAKLQRGNREKKSLRWGKLVLIAHVPRAG